MRSVIAAIAICFAPALASAQSDAVLGNSYYDYEDPPKSNIERSVRKYERQQIAEQAQRDYYYQRDEAQRQKAMLKELQDINDNQRRMMGEDVPFRFSDD